MPPCRNRNSKNPRPDRRGGLPIARDATHRVDPRHVPTSPADTSAHLGDVDARQEAPTGR